MKIDKEKFKKARIELLPDELEIVDLVFAPSSEGSEPTVEPADAIDTFKFTVGEDDDNYQAYTNIMTIYEDRITFDYKESANGEVKHKEINTIFGIDSFFDFVEKLVKDSKCDDVCFFSYPSLVKERESGKESVVFLTYSIVDIKVIVCSAI